MRFKVRSMLTVLAVTAVLATGAPRAVGAAESEQRVDINSASVAELTALPGIGESKAKAIVEHRAAEPFKTVDDLKKVKGIGDKTLEDLRSQITVGAESAKH